MGAGLPSGLSLANERFVRTLTIGIAGGTASGKTTVARRLVERLSGHAVAFLDQDSYYRDLSDLPMEERVRFNFDHPDAFDTELFEEHLTALQAGNAVNKPVYSFQQHSRTEETVRVNPGDVIIVEGILVLGLEQVRKHLDVKVFEQYFRTVRPMHFGFVEPSKRYADIIIPHGGNNDVAIDMVSGLVRARMSGA